MQPHSLLGYILAVTAAAPAPAPTPTPQGRNVPGVYFSDEPVDIGEPSRIVVVPEDDLRPADVDPRDLHAVEKVVAALVGPPAAVSPTVLDLPMTEVRWRDGRPYDFEFRPLRGAALRSQLAGCQRAAIRRAAHRDMPARSFFVVAWACPSDPPKDVRGTEQITMISIEDHRPVDIYHHANGVVPVWSPRSGSQRGQ